MLETHAEVQALPNVKVTPWQDIYARAENHHLCEPCAVMGAGLQLCMRSGISMSL